MIIYRNAEQLKSLVKENTAHLCQPASIENRVNALSWSLHPVKTPMLAITSVDQIVIALEAKGVVQMDVVQLALILN